MEALKVLEDRVISLVELVSKLKEEKEQLTSKNIQVIQEKEALEAKMKELECSQQEDAKKACALDKERENASVLLDDLIKSIDSLVEGEVQ